jgi:hypothetical protein
MTADLCQRPSFGEIAARLAARDLTHPPRPAEAVTELPAVPEPVVADPEIPARLTRCEKCGYLRGMLGHVWACLAPNGRWRR